MFDTKFPQSHRTEKHMSKKEHGLKHNFYEQLHETHPGFLLIVSEKKH